MIVFAFMVFKIAVVMVYIDVYRYRSYDDTIVRYIDNTGKSIADRDAGGVVDVNLYCKCIGSANINRRTSGLVKLESGGMGAGNRVYDTFSRNITDLGNRDKVGLIR